MMTSGRGPDVSRLIRGLPRRPRQDLAAAPAADNGVHQWMLLVALKSNLRGGACKSFADPDFGKDVETDNQEI